MISKKLAIAAAFVFLAGAPALAQDAAPAPAGMADQAAPAAGAPDQPATPATPVTVVTPVDVRRSLMIGAWTGGKYMQLNLADCPK